MKTISELNEKVWYRAIKSIYIIIFFSVTLGLIYLIITDGIHNDTLIPLMYLVILEIFRRSFYYIILGKLFPNKD